MPKDMPRDMTPVDKVVLAAGAVLWRSIGDVASDASVEIAIVHRPRYDDWSLPKGKVDPGETEAVTAVREVHEETGYTAILGRRLNEDTYTVQLIDEQERLVSLVKGDLRQYAVVLTSPMPSYKDKLSSQDLADVVSYLLSLKGVQ